MVKQPIFLRLDNQTMKINPDDILLLEAARNFVKFYMANDTIYLVRTSLDTALQQLPEKLFLKVHRSFAVSVLHVDAIDREVISIRGFKELVPFSRKYYPEFIKQVTIIGSA